MSALIECDGRVYYQPVELRFTLEDVDRAADAWGCNCGPAAIAAVMRISLEQLRPHLGDFEQKRYTNPTLMWDVLRSLGADWFCNRVRSVDPASEFAFPPYGLARIQWEGPWTAPGVPMAARYRHTHWVGSAREAGNLFVFDVNAMCAGGWLLFQEWATQLVPWLLKQVEPKASGAWSVTHSVEIHGSVRL